MKGTHFKTLSNPDDQPLTEAQKNMGVLEDRDFE